jgi:hypothetical protein
MKTFLLITLIFIPFVLLSQSPSWQWAKGTGRYISHDYCNSIGSDQQGNSYITGEFQDSLDFGATTLVNSGTYNYILFLAKYDASGNVIWANSPGGNHASEGTSIYVDANGFFYVTGSYKGTITFGSTSLTATGVSNMFVAKFDTSGNALWAKDATGNFNNKGLGITTDASGNIYVTGTFEDSAITFGNIVLPGDFLSDVFTVKYDDTGNVLWAKDGHGRGMDVSNSICTDESGNVFITGVFRDSIQFGSTTLYGSNNGSATVFVLKYDGSGNVLWGKNSGGFPSSGYGMGISSDVAGNCYVTGYFGSPIIYFDSDTLVNNGVEDLFIVKYNAQGNVSWVKGGGGPSFDRGYGICTDDGGISYVTGFFKASASFGGFNFFGSNNETIALKYDSSGNVIWGLQNTGSLNDIAYGISIDGNGNAYIGGSFSSPTSLFGSISLTNSDQFLGSYDLFVASIHTLSTSIAESQLESSRNSVFPNPFSESAILRLDGDKGKSFHFELYNSQGNIVRSVENLSQGIFELKRDGLSQGIYLYKLIPDHGFVESGKLVIY